MSKNGQDALTHLRVQVYVHGKQNSAIASCPAKETNGLFDARRLSISNALKVTVEPASLHLCKNVQGSSGLYSHFLFSHFPSA